MLVNLSFLRFSVGRHVKALSCSHYWITQRSDIGDFDLDYIAVFNLRRATFRAHPNNVAGLKLHVSRHAREEGLNAEEHFVCVEADSFFAVKSHYSFHVL